MEYKSPIERELVMIIIHGFAEVMVAEDICISAT